MTNPAWTTTAAAKLNLTLEVLGKRDDGFHDLASVAVSLDLADQVRLTRTADERSVTYLDEWGRASPSKHPTTSCSRRGMPWRNGWSCPAVERWR